MDRMKWKTDGKKDAKLREHLWKPDAKLMGNVWKLLGRFIEICWGISFCKCVELSWSFLEGWKPDGTCMDFCWNTAGGE